MQHYKTTLSLSVCMSVSLRLKFEAFKPNNLGCFGHKSASQFNHFHTLLTHTKFNLNIYIERDIIEYGNMEKMRMTNRKSDNQATKYYMSKKQ